MLSIKKESMDGDYKITEYDNGTIVRELVVISTGEVNIDDPQPTLDEIIRANYLETQYQTVLLEMQSGM